ncbi:hypothetical protein DFQ27_000861, partial [Actinomortierella ambigua]
AFTDAQAKARVIIENTFADLKNKFQSLSRIPLEVENEQDRQKVVKWCVACVVLHNFALLCDQDTGDLRDPSNKFYDECKPRLEEHRRRLAAAPNFAENTRALGVQRRKRL